MRTALKFFLRSSPDKKTLDRILQYMNEFGHGKARVGQQDSFTVLLLDDRRDGEIFRHQFGGLADAWVDYKR
jgi:hypothetical protein